MMLQMASSVVVMNATAPKDSRGTNWSNPRMRKITWRMTSRRELAKYGK